MEELTVPEPKISLVEILPGLPSVMVKRSTSGTASPASIGIVRAAKWRAVLELLASRDFGRKMGSSDGDPKTVRRAGSSTAQ